MSAADQIIIAERAKTPPTHWTAIGDLIGLSRDAVRRRYAALQRASTTTSEPVQDVDPTNSEILRLERQKSVLEDSVRELRKKLKATHKEESLFVQLAHVIREETKPLPFVFPAERARLQYDPNGVRERTPVDAVLLLSDEHADEVVKRELTWGVEEYDFNVFRARLDRLRKVITAYVTEHLPAHRFEHLWVMKLGDSVNGDIHDNGPKNHFRNTVKAALATGDAEAQFIQALEPLFEQGVTVVSIAGNHPRRTKMKEYESPHNNFDYLVATQIAARLDSEIAAGRVRVIAPESYTAYVEVRGRVWALNHGDDITSYTGLPWVGFDRKNNRVQTMVRSVGGKVDFYASGHYHTPASFPSAGGISFHNGAFPACDAYSIGKLAVGGVPQQLFCVQDDRFGVIMQVPIFLKNEERENALRAGEWEPELGTNLVIDVVSPAASEGFQLIRRGEEAA